MLRLCVVRRAGWAAVEWTGVCLAAEVLQSWRGRRETTRSLSGINTKSTKPQKKNSSAPRKKSNNENKCKCNAHRGGVNGRGVL